MLFVVFFYGLWGTAVAVVTVVLCMILCALYRAVCAVIDRLSICWVDLDEAVAQVRAITCLYCEGYHDRRCTCEGYCEQRDCPWLAFYADLDELGLLDGGQHE